MGIPTRPSPPKVNSFSSAEGARIFQIPMEVFPGFWAYAYLILVEDYRVLIDTGSGFGPAGDQLETGLNTIHDDHGLPAGVETLTHILITHGHIDHFGGLVAIRPRTPAKVGVHELDLSTVSHYEERLTVISRRLRSYLMESGLSPDSVRQLMELHNFTKGLYHSVGVDFTFEDGDMRVGPFQMLHVPGHCAGHVVVRVHDVLFSGDHVLAGISPHQAPESLTASTGLGHYLESLDALRNWSDGVRLTLGGHNEPVIDLPARIDSIKRIHFRRLDRVLEMLKTPRTIKDVSEELFGRAGGYHVLLALEEAGAHIEYLYQRGLLVIDNLVDLEKTDQVIPIRYRRV
jgi:glyoxylase-like metal-dependent hydrolase (beta-lactamase superfamily II)